MIVLIKTLPDVLSANKNTGFAVQAHVDIMIGVDLTRISRIGELVARRGIDRFSRWILSPVELAAFKNGQDLKGRRDLQYLASRWAAKEALFKACYPEHRLRWHQVTIGKGPGGEPTVSIDIDSPLRARVSISHDGDLVIASALLIK